MKKDIVDVIYDWDHGVGQKGITQFGKDEVIKLKYAVKAADEIVNLRWEISDLKEHIENLNMRLEAEYAEWDDLYNDLAKGRVKIDKLKIKIKNKDRQIRALKDTNELLEFLIDLMGNEEQEEQ
jgi:chromosome segregation ATPase